VYAMLSWGVKIRLVGCGFHCKPEVFFVMKG
jgi:hypothetical protein